MSGNVISAVKAVHEKSGIPVVFTDSSFCVTWKNKLAASLFSEGECLSDTFEKVSLREGVVNAYQGDAIYSLNVIRLDNKDEKDSEYEYMVEFLHTDSMVRILNIPEIKNYIYFICSKIKEAAGVVVNSADEIYDAVSCGLYDGRMITDRLNIIDENIMSVTKEIVMPDQFYALMDMENKNKATLAMDRELQRLVGNIRSEIGKAVKITSTCERGVFFRMDPVMLETVVMGMTERCCCGKIYPETLVYSVSRISEERAELSVMSISPESRKNNVRLKTIMEAELRNIKRGLFFDYICDVLCSGFGVAFTQTEMPNGYNFKMEFNIISGSEPRIAIESTDYHIRRDRFGRDRFDMASLMLADFPVQKRYSYYDIDSEDSEESGEENQEPKDESS